MPPLRSLRAALSLVAALLAPAAAREKAPTMRAAFSCDGAIPGDWTGYFPQPLGDLYTLTWTQPPSPGAWTATMESGGGWGVGKGQFSPDNFTTTISLDSGVNLRGGFLGKWTLSRSRFRDVFPPPPCWGWVVGVVVRDAPRRLHTLASFDLASVQATSRTIAR